MLIYKIFSSIAKHKISTSWKYIISSSLSLKTMTVRTFSLKTLCFTEKNQNNSFAIIHQSSYNLSSIRPTFRMSENKIEWFYVLLFNMGRSSSVPHDTQSGVCKLSGITLISIKCKVFVNHYMQLPNKWDTGMERFCKCKCLHLIMFHIKISSQRLCHVIVIVSITILGHCINLNCRNPWPTYHVTHLCFRLDLVAIVILMMLFLFLISVSFMLFYCFIVYATVSEIRFSPDFNSLDIY